jgi:hypothetical protein
LIRIIQRKSEMEKAAMTSDGSPRSAWTPPPRPDWVQRINDEGACMDISGTVPLDPESLIASAIRSTGLSDFGAGEWREPFEVLCKSLEEDADLNLLGRIRTRSELLLLLTARLQIEETYKQHPEIDDEEIVHPLIVVGQGRSGTSFLLNLLSSNPENGVIMTWEATFPCPPPEAATYLTDPRIEKAHQLADQCNRVTPELLGMHEFSGRIPQDCTQILGLTFLSEGWFNVMAQIAGYNRYLATADQEPAFRYHKRVLKLLQWKNPRKQWVLKDPTHLEKITTILKVYPDACFVWPHRDPAKSVASTISIIGTMLWGRTDHPFKGSSFDAYTDPVPAAKRLTDVIDQLESGVIPKDRVYSILYRDLVADPVGTAAKIHEYFHLPFSAKSRAAMEEYMRRNPRTARPPHKVDAQTRSAVDGYRSAFKRYQDHFGVPNEA